MENQELARRDLSILWHPCTQMKDHETYPLIPIKRAQGLYLEDLEGNHYMDAIGSWWVSLLGHGHPRVNKALHQQLDLLSQVMFAGFTHEPAVELAERLVKYTPPGLTHVFYADNGSAATEVALKMSYHAWHNQNHPEKRRFMALNQSYHGETLGALSVSQIDLYKKQYQDLLFDPIEIPCADSRHKPDHLSEEAYADEVLNSARLIMEKHAHETCALIAEPLVQCAAGMRMHSIYFLKKLFELTREYNIHFIADEIAVGFGRTGTLFACEQAGITPDFMCLSKGITGGYLPLSAVLTTDFIYSLFYDDYATGKAFLHSHSYTGNALACAAAVATIDTLIEEKILEKNQSKIEYFDCALKELRQHPHVQHVRQQGMIIAMDVCKKDGTLYPAHERRGLAIHSHALSKGVLLRPIGNTVYFMPAFCVTLPEIDTLCNVTLSSIEFATGNSL